MATLVHDLKNPLLGNNRILDLLNKRNLPEQDREEITRALKLSNDRMLTLVNNMLDVYRNDAGLIKAVIGEFAIYDLVEACITELGPLATSRQTEIKNNTQTNLKIKADNHLLSRVLLNILDNAIKFSRENSVIYIQTSLKYEKVFVSVKDTGIGIPKESIKKIWDRFYKSDLSRGKDKKGTGLGLAIVKEIIQAHGENIDVISTQGVGSEFIFTLPKATAL